jgi:hypothetical protein
VNIHIKEAEGEEKEKNRKIRNFSISCQRPRCCLAQILGPQFRNPLLAILWLGRLLSKESQNIPEKVIVCQSYFYSNRSEGFIPALFEI